VQSGEEQLGQMQEQLAVSQIKGVKQLEFDEGHMQAQLSISNEKGLSHIFSEHSLHLHLFLSKYFSCGHAQLAHR
jgi:hypothetical protein